MLCDPAFEIALRRDVEGERPAEAVADDRDPLQAECVEQPDEVLMGIAGVRGVKRSKKVFTTKSDPAAVKPAAAPASLMPTWRS